MGNSTTVVILGGPNGAGKSTCAAILIPDSVPFINADEIAKTLPNFPSPAADVEAGRILLRRMDEYAAQNADFAVETTLSSRALAPRIKRLRAAGYRFSLGYVWLPDVELSIARVAERVRSGGHNIPEDVIRRRYKAGLKNFFELYRPIADEWTVYMNTVYRKPLRIAFGTKMERIEVYNETVWEDMLRENKNE